MTKYRPVEGRSIEDVKAGDFIRSQYDEIHWVIARLDECAWIRPHLVRGFDPLALPRPKGWLTLIECLKENGTEVVEPIPEPEIESAYCLVPTHRSSLYRSVDLARSNYLPGAAIQRVTFTNGKITAVELVKNET